MKARTFYEKSSKEEMIKQMELLDYEMIIISIYNDYAKDILTYSYYIDDLKKYDLKCLFDNLDDDMNLISYTLIQK